VFRQDRDQWRETYEAELHGSVLPFWLTHSLDRDDGGYITCLDRQGSSYSTDKSILLIARCVLLYSRLINRVRREGSWCEAAEIGVRFLLRHLAETLDRPYLLVTKTGKPLERFPFSVEAYVTASLAEYAAAADDREALATSRRVRKRLLDLYGAEIEPDRSDEVQRRGRALLPPLLLLGTCQVLRDLDPAAVAQRAVDAAVEDLLTSFLDRQSGLLCEYALPAGGARIGPAGRMVIPGHGIHVAGLLLQESRRRPELLDGALRLLEASLENSWDAEYGGLIHVVDLEERPSLHLDWDMKLWWVHTEALFATLLAGRLTETRLFERWHERIHEYAFAHYPDADYGGWLGYLHRDGTPITTAKGSHWKSAYHEAMALWQCIAVLSEEEA